MQIQPAVKKETLYITTGTLAATLAMFAAFWLLHRIMPDAVPFNYKVILSGIFGALAAVGNFFFMGLTVQKIASTENEDEAFKSMRASYRFRTMSQLLWVALSFALPCFNGAAGIIPLFFPSMCIKLRGILGIIK